MASSFCWKSAIPAFECTFRLGSLNHPCGFEPLEALEEHRITCPIERRSAQLSMYWCAGCWTWVCDCARLRTAPSEINVCTCLFIAAFQSRNDLTCSEIFHNG